MQKKKRVIRTYINAWESYKVSLKLKFNLLDRKIGKLIERKWKELVFRYQNKLKSWRRNQMNQTDVSELNLKRNRFDLGYITSSLMLKWGKLYTEHNRDTSFCLNWKVIPSFNGRESKSLQMRDQFWSGICSFSF